LWKHRAGPDHRSGGVGLTPSSACGAAGSMSTLGRPNRTLILSGIRKGGLDYV
jgi:hypothetical protein